MYGFILLNIARLFTKKKLKYKVLCDLCRQHYSYVCETFLMDSVNDSEILLLIVLQDLIKTIIMSKGGSSILHTLHTF